MNEARTERNLIKCTHYKTKTNPLLTPRASMQAGINQISSQADKVYFTLKEWPTLRSTRDH